MVQAERRGPVVGLQRLGGAAQAVQGVGAAVMAVGEIRIEGEGRLAGLERLVVAAEPDQGVGAVVVGVDEAGVQRRRPVAGGQGLLQPPKLAQGEAEVALRRRLVGIEGQGLADQLGAPLHAAGLDGDGPHQLQGVGVVGLGQQHLLVGLLRLLELPLAVQGEGLVENLGELVRIHAGEGSLRTAGRRSSRPGPWPPRASG